MRSLFWKWLWANVFGGVRGAAIGSGVAAALLDWSAIGLATPKPDSATYLPYFVTLHALPAGVFAFLVALEQERVLSPLLPIDDRWCFGVALGAALGAMLGLATALLTQVNIVVAVAAGTSAGMGVAQWLYWRSTVKGAGWWLTTYPAALAIVVFAILAAGATLETSEILSLAWHGAVAWLVASALTGLALIVTVRDPRNEKLRPTQPADNSFTPPRANA